MQQSRTTGGATSTTATNQSKEVSSIEKFNQSEAAKVHHQNLLGASKRMYSDELTDFNGARWRRTFIGKSFSTGSVFYHGDMLNRGDYMEGEKAHDYWKKIKNETPAQDWLDIDVVVLSKPITFGLPAIASAEEATQDITEEIRDYVFDLSVDYQIQDDSILVFWERFAQMRRIHTDGNKLYLEKVEGGGQSSIDIEGLVEKSDNSIPTLMKKEFIEGFYRDEPLYVQGEPVDLSMTKEFSDGKVHGVYMDVMRTLAFKDFSEKSKNLKDRPVSNGQYDILANIGKVTVFASARKLGKTSIIMNYATGRAYSHNPSRRPYRMLWLSTSTDAIETAKFCIRTEMADLIDTSNIDETSSDDVFTFYDIYDEGKSKRTRNDRVLATMKIKYVSKQAMDKHMGLGGVYDLVVFDEINDITEKYFNALMHIIINEGGQLIGMMNFSIDGERTYMYDEFIKMENERRLKEREGYTVEYCVNYIWDKYKLGSYNSLKELLEAVDMKSVRDEFRAMRPDIGKRYSIHDNDLLTEQQKLSTIDYFSEKDYVAYLTHVECVMPNEVGVFDLSKIRVQYPESKLKDFEFLFFAYDPSKNSQDPSRVITAGYTSNPSSPMYNQIVAFDELVLPQTELEDQALFFKEYQDRMLNTHLSAGQTKGRHITLYDPNGLGVAVRSYLNAAQVTNLLAVQVTGQGRKSDFETGKAIVNKKDFIESLASSIREDIIKITKNMKTTYKELANMEKQKTPSGGVTYNAKGSKQHDDCVTCIAMINLFCLMNGIKERILLQKIQELSDKSDAITFEEDIHAYIRMLNEKKKRLESGLKEGKSRSYNALY